MCAKCYYKSKSQTIAAEKYCRFSLHLQLQFTTNIWTNVVNKYLTPKYYIQTLQNFNISCVQFLFKVIFFSLFQNNVKYFYLMYLNLILIVSHHYITLWFPSLILHYVNRIFRFYQFFFKFTSFFVFENRILTI